MTQGLCAQGTIAGRMVEAQLGLTAVFRYSVAPGTGANARFEIASDRQAYNQGPVVRVAGGLDEGSEPAIGDAGVLCSNSTGNPNPRLRPGICSLR